MMDQLLPIQDVINTPCAFILPSIRKVLKHVEGPLPSKILKSLTESFTIGEAVKMLDSIVDAEERKIIEEFLPNILKTQIAAGINEFVAPDQSDESKPYTISDDECRI